MAKTINDAHLSLAYRLGSSSIPTSTTELAKRLNWFQKAIEISTQGDKPLWFMKDTVYMNTVANQDAYSFPTNVRLINNLKVDGYRYTKIPQEEVYQRYELPTAPVAILPSYQHRAYYEWGNTFVLMPTPGSNGTNNIELRVVKNPTLPTSGSSGIVLPDPFEDILVSYAEARYWSAAHKRAKSADAFAEFEDLVLRLKLEDTRHQLFEDIEQKAPFV